MSRIKLVRSRIFTWLALEVGDLLGGEVVVEYHESYFVFVDILLYLVKLSLSHIGARVGVIESLQECLFGDRSRRVGEKSEFVEILLGLSLILLRGYEAHEYGLFRSFGAYYVLFHA